MNIRSELLFDSSYVAENVEYYRAQFDLYRKSGTLKFNWAAFIFAGWWCFYRKLYLLGMLLLVAESLPGVGLIANLVAGFMGNKWYLEQMDESLAVGDLTTAGVNKWIVWAALAALALCVLIAIAATSLLIGVVSSGIGN